MAAGQQAEDMRGALGLTPGGGESATRQKLLADRNGLLADENAEQADERD